jgi:hypothetical protein
MGFNGNTPRSIGSSGKRCDPLSFVDLFNYATAQETVAEDW